MHKRRWGWLVALIGVIALLFAATPVHAASNLPADPQDHAYYDGINLLDSQTRQLIDQKNSFYNEQSERPQIKVAAIKSTDGEALGEYAPDLFEKWGIGKKGEDNGVLILYADNDGKQNMRIEVGYGLEGELTDALSGQILNQNLDDIKSSDKADVNKAIRNVFNAVATVIDKKYDYPKDDNTVSDDTMSDYEETNDEPFGDYDDDDSSNGIFTMVLVIFLVVIIIISIFGGGGPRGGGRRRGGNWWLLWLLSDLLSSGSRYGRYGRGGRGGFGGGGGFGSGGGFGGGGFGGGGGGGFGGGGGASGGGGADV
ncbi:TPM domain-containing protein [Lacticaseibacillus yichunensis]|uniref:TPM domain-containing protein n=1 Tax=Lacticaseibacillus yichunensis TaxID=2486015 RepID=A0ABW4CLT1_9LACO|nr:TPM domain-containing protein [Lacticaseibacillus yichunensis]